MQLSLYMALQLRQSRHNQNKHFRPGSSQSTEKAWSKNFDNIVSCEEQSISFCIYLIILPVITNMYDCLRNNEKDFFKLHFFFFCIYFIQIIFILITVVLNYINYSVYISTVKWNNLQKSGKIDIFEKAPFLSFKVSSELKNERALHFMYPRVVLISTQLV